jgi:hypothetical protein
VNATQPDDAALSQATMQSKYEPLAWALEYEPTLVSELQAIV